MNAENDRIKKEAEKSAAEPESEQSQESFDQSSATIPKEIPILPLGDMVVFPQMILPLIVKQEHLIKMVENLVVGDKILGTVLFTRW